MTSVYSRDDVARARQQSTHCMERADRDAARVVVAEYHAQTESDASKRRRARHELLLAKSLGDA